MVRVMPASGPFGQDINPKRAAGPPPHPAADAALGDEAAREEPAPDEKATTPSPGAGPPPSQA